MKKKSKIPLLLDLLLKLFLDKDNYAEKSGDLTEVYCVLKEEGSHFWSVCWVTHQSIKTVIAHLMDKIVWGGAMFKNYMVVSLRNLFRQKVFSLINIFGLAIGFTCCMLIGMFVQDELSVDAYHEFKDRIYLVGEYYKIGGQENIGSASNAMTATVLAGELPEVEKAARFKELPSTLVKYGNKSFTENRIVYADPDLFSIFTWKFIDGDPQTALKEPNSLVITENFAEKYFGKENPMGKTLKFNDELDFTVTGVMANIPVNTMYDAEAFCPMQSFINQNGPDSPILTEWISFNFRTFFLVKENTDVIDLEKKLNDAYLGYSGELQKSKGMEIRLLLKHIDDLYLRPFGGNNQPITYVYIFSLVALALLLIACANFMNLSTARSASRAKEVGIRKVLGSERKRIITQFLTESILLSFLSLALSFLLTWLCLPILNEILGYEILFSVLFQTEYLIYIILAAILVGFFAGAYPAFYLSSFKPVSVLKGKLKSGSSNSGLRKMLVITQYAISIVLIIGSGVIYQQLEYLRTKDPGFNKEQILILGLPDENSRPSFEILRTEFSSLASVMNVSASSTLPGWGSPQNAKIPDGFTIEQTQLMDEINVDRDFIKTMGMQLVVGRDFSEKYGLSEPNSVIINETAVKRYGWSDPLGKIIKTPDFNIRDGKTFIDMKVIGVVKDFHQRDMMSTIEPVYIANIPDFPFAYNKFSVLILHLEKGDMTNSIAEVESKWNSLFQDSPFSYRFFDQIFDRQFRRVERAQTIVGYFTLLTMLVACLGLFGLISFLSEQRTKEIGIRKALGASFPNLIGLLLKDFSKWILVANILAWPMSYFIVSMILDNFAYRIDVGLTVFLVSGLSVFVIGVTTILSRVIKTALTNPVEALKYE